jgi:hypothetical protein
VPYIEEITLLSIPNETVMPTFFAMLRSGEEAWLNHLHKIWSENNGELQEIPMTYSGYFSHSQPEYVRPRATIGEFPIFYEKASSMSIQKHSMLTQEGYRVCESWPGSRNRR